MSNTAGMSPQFLDLNARLKQLQAEQLSMDAQGPPYDPSKSDLENATAAREFHDRMGALMKEQLTIYATLRKTAAGPAAKGGKRAKKAPLDLSALEDSVFS
jgi:hypothetical protein